MSDSLKKGLFQQFSAKMPDKYYGDGVNCVGGMSVPFVEGRLFIVVPGAVE
jgi:hypothetical protein